MSSKNDAPQPQLSFLGEFMIHQLSAGKLVKRVILDFSKVFDRLGHDITVD